MKKNIIGTSILAAGLCMYPITSHALSTSSDNNPIAATGALSNTIGSMVGSTVSGSIGTTVGGSVGASTGSTIGASAGGFVAPVAPVVQIGRASCRERVSFLV